MKTTDLNTYKAVIIVGMKEGYSGPVHDQQEVLVVCQEFCDRVGFGVEVHFGQCVYTRGNEPSASISLVNYPRFPRRDEEVFALAEQLGLLLARHMRQLRFTIVATDVTRMYEEF